MRIVSLVPSLTLTLFDLGLTSNEIVGRTPWCIHPAEKVSEVMVVGGTKTPNLNKIRKLKPDLIVMDKEENPLEVYEQLLSEGFKIFVSEVEHPNDVPDMLKKLGEACDKAKQGEIMAQNCTIALMNCLVDERKFATIPLIWYQPIMAVSPRKYPGAILTHVGFDVIDTHPKSNGYPELTMEDFVAHQPMLILLTSEPHEFTRQEGEEISQRIISAGGARPMVKLIDGEDLTWFGSKTAKAIKNLGNLYKLFFEEFQHQSHE